MHRSDGARDQLVRGIASAKAGETELARGYFERALQLDPDHRGRVDAYYWLARLSSSKREKRDFLIQVLQLEPTHYAARRDLALIDGTLVEEELVDPNEPQSHYAAEPSSPQSHRYVCPRCGGRLTSPAGSSGLACGYCGFEEQSAQSEAAVPEADYIQALVTAKGHTRPEKTPTFTCQACGASYLLAPGTLSVTCPHCGSVYTVDRLEESNLVPPEGLVPFQVKQGTAGLKLRQWLDEQSLHSVEGFAPLHGVYLPAWTFDLSGEVPYTYMSHQGDRWENRRGSHILMENDLPVAASHHLPKTLSDEVRRFDLSALHPYNPALLAGWPAEAYEIPATDAAMAARWHVLDGLRQRVERELPGAIRELHFHSSDILISAYRLILLPVWITNYRLNGERYQVVVNGQSGTISAEKPPPGWWASLRGLFTSLAP